MRHTDVLAPAERRRQRADRKPIRTSRQRFAGEKRVDQDDLFGCLVNRLREWVNTRACGELRLDRRLQSLHSRTCFHGAECTAPQGRRNTSRIKRAQQIDGAAGRRLAGGAGICLSYWTRTAVAPEPIVKLVIPQAGPISANTLPATAAAERHSGEPSRTHLTSGSLRILSKLFHLDLPSNSPTLSMTMRRHIDTKSRRENGSRITAAFVDDMAPPYHGRAYWHLKCMVTL